MASFTHQKDLILNLVRRNFVVGFKGSTLGILWSALLPLFQLLVLVFVFRKIIPLGIKDFPEFVLAGLLPWNWFSTSINSAGNTFLSNKDLMSRPDFAPHTLVVIDALTNLLTFLISLPILFGLLALGGRGITIGLLFFPLLVLIEGILIVGLGLLIAILKPWVWLLGSILHRDHTPEVRKSMCFIKMQGGGSLVIAYPAILGLKRQYQWVTFSLIATKEVTPFAESLGVFDRIDEIDDSSLFQLVKSAFLALNRNLLVDTVVDLEVYSRLTAIMSTLTGARIRIGFYLEGFFWRKGLITHLVFFNRSSGSFVWYDTIARLLGAEPVPTEACRQFIKQTLGLRNEPRSRIRRIAVGHACSRFAGERMLTEEQWISVLQQHLPFDWEIELILLGASADRDLANRIINVLGQSTRDFAFKTSVGPYPLGNRCAQSTHATNSGAWTQVFSITQGCLVSSV